MNPAGIGAIRTADMVSVVRADRGRAGHRGGAAFNVHFGSGGSLDGRLRDVGVELRLRHRSGFGAITLVDNVSG